MIQITDLTQSVNPTSKNAKSRLNKKKSLFKSLNILSILIILGFLILSTAVAIAIFFPDIIPSLDIDETKEAESVNGNNLKDKDKLFDLDTEMDELKDENASSSAMLDRLSPPADSSSDSSDLANLITPTLLAVYSKELTEHYQNENYNYEIFYDNRWEFRITYGEEVEKAVKTDVLSGFDLHRYLNEVAVANIGVNILSTKGETELDQWLEKYELNEPSNDHIKIEFNGVEANYYSYQQTEGMKNRALFFLKNDHFIKIWWWAKTSQSLKEATAIVETFLIE